MCHVRPRGPRTTGVGRGKAAAPRLGRVVTTILLYSTLSHTIHYSVQLGTPFLNEATTLRRLVQVTSRGKRATDPHAGGVISSPPGGLQSQMHLAISTISSPWPTVSDTCASAVARWHVYATSACCSTLLVTVRCFWHSLARPVVGTCSELWWPRCSPPPHTTLHSTDVAHSPMSRHCVSGFMARGFSRARSRSRRGAAFVLKSLVGTCGRAVVAEVFAAAAQHYSDSCKLLCPCHVLMAPA